MPSGGFYLGSFERGGKGQNGDGTWPETDGRGCPVCGAIRGGGHGGGCPNRYLVFDEDNRDITEEYRRSLLRRLGGFGP